MASSADDATPPTKIVLRRTCPGCGAKFPAEREFCPECHTEYLQARALRTPRRTRPEPFALERLALGWGVWGGVSLIVVAVVWFVVGWHKGFIFWYPPVLVLLGIYGVWRGLASRGKKPPLRRRRGRTST